MQPGYSSQPSSPSPPRSPKAPKTADIKRMEPCISTRGCCPAVPEPSGTGASHLLPGRVATLRVLLGTAQQPDLLSAAQPGMGTAAQLSSPLWHVRSCAIEQQQAELSGCPPSALSCTQARDRCLPCPSPKYSQHIAAERRIY